MRNKPLSSLNLIAIGLISIVLSCQKAGNSTNPSGPTISNLTITSLAPAHGPYNTIDTLTGKGFDQFSPLDSVVINGKEVTIISHSDQQIIFQIPLLAGTGHVDIWSKGTKYQAPIFTYDSILLVTTIAGSSGDAGEVDGKGLDARFNDPYGIAVDHAGNIYVSDRGGSCIRKIDTGSNVTTLAGPHTYEESFADGTGAAARFAVPLGLCIDQQGFLYVADQNNFRVRKVSPSGVVTTFGMLWDGIPKDGFTDGADSVATFDTPWGVACDSAGNLYVADIYNNKIRKITPSGMVSSFAGGDYYHSGIVDGQGSSARFLTPYALTIDPHGNLFVVDGTGQYIRKVTPAGVVSTVIGPSAPNLVGPYDNFQTATIASDKYGNIYFTISSGIIKMTPDGQYIRYAVGGVGDLDGPVAVASFREIFGMVVDDAGTLYLTDNQKIRKIAWQ